MKTILQRNIKDLCIERQATAEQGAQLVSYCCFLDYLSHGPPSISKIIFFKYESFSSCPPSPTALFSSVSWYLSFTYFVLIIFQLFPLLLVLTASSEQEQTPDAGAKILGQAVAQQGAWVRALMTSWEAAQCPGFGRGFFRDGLAPSSPGPLGARALLACLQTSWVFFCATYVNFTLGHLKSHLKYQQPHHTPSLSLATLVGVAGAHRHPRGYGEQVGQQHWSPG